MRLFCLLVLLTVLVGCVLTPQPAVEQPTLQDEETAPVRVIPTPQSALPAKVEPTGEAMAEPQQTLPDDQIAILEETAFDETVSEEIGPYLTPEIIAAQEEVARQLCQEIGSKLGSVSVEDCLGMGLQHSAYTTNARSLAYRDYLPLGTKAPLGRVLLIGGIHGDEFSSVSIVFKWMEILNLHHSGLFLWRFVPVANPDGLLKKKSQRQNHNGVDLNRNFPSADWESHAHSYWVDVARRNPRRHPGPTQASEAETQWLVKQIEEFQPDAIVSMHAPFHLVDYDGPPSGPEKLGGLYLRQLGVYPGSLGNYAGIGLNLPVVTVELKSAGIMPRNTEIDRMWGDLVGWLQKQMAQMA